MQGTKGSGGEVIRKVGEGTGRKIGRRLEEVRKWKWRERKERTSVSQES